jgi:hypothetical protein
MVSTILRSSLSFFFLAHELATLTNTTVMRYNVLCKDKEEAALRATIAVCNRLIPKQRDTRRYLALMQLFSLLCDAY